MQNNFMQEESLTENFVSPLLCLKLQEAGMTARVPYHWRQTPISTVLATYNFDPDCYYQAALPMLHQFSIITIIPAYSIKEVEKVLPCGYLLSLDAMCQYELMLSNLYNVEPVTGERLADTFAAMVLKLINARLVNLQKVNILIQQK